MSTELHAWCGGAAPHGKHTFNAGKWCPGLRDPAIAVYELRPHYKNAPILRLEEGTDDERFPQAVDIADALSGPWDIWRIAPSPHMTAFWDQRDIEDYIVSSGPYWRDGEGVLHQIMSRGACWDCYKEAGQAVRHPVTPGEVLTGVLLPAAMHDGDPCPACGGGYRFWVTGEPPGGWDYKKHESTCAIMSGEKGEEDYQ